MLRNIDDKNKEADAPRSYSQGQIRLAMLKISFIDRVSCEKLFKYTERPRF